MKYLSIDIETTGLNPERNQILEFCAILDDSSLISPKLEVFHRYVKWDYIVGEPVALEMNAKILNRKDSKPYQVIIKEFKDFLKKHSLEKPFAAGKNFGSFDRMFLKQWDLHFHHRCLDPVSLYFEPGDAGLPSLDVCLQRAGISGGTDHTAFGDALKVIKLLRRKWYPVNLNLTVEGIYDN